MRHLWGHDNQQNQTENICNLLFAILSHRDLTLIVDRKSLIINAIRV